MLAPTPTISTTTFLSLLTAGNFFPFRYKSFISELSPNYQQHLTSFPTGPLLLCREQLATLFVASVPALLVHSLVGACLVSESTLSSDVCIGVSSGQMMISREKRMRDVSRLIPIPISISIPVF